MNMTVIEIIGKIIGVAFAVAFLYLAPKVKEWLSVNTTKQSQEAIILLIQSFAQAAEQLLKDKDGSGEKRMEYVKNELNALGIEITHEIVSMIEGAVWEINNKSGGKQVEV